MVPEKSHFYEQVVLCQGVFAFVFFLQSVCVFVFAVVGSVAVASPPCFYSHFV